LKETRRKENKKEEREKKDEEKEEEKHRLSLIQTKEKQIEDD